jgi:transposase
VKRFVEGRDRAQLILLPECLDDFVGEDNPVRVVDAFIEELDLAVLGFAGVVPEATGRPSYHPATLLKIYLYGYLNQVQSSRRLERETRRNLEVMWLTGRLTPDFKTIADFRRDNGAAIRAVCSQFVALCRRLDLLTHAVIAIDGSKFKAVNNRDKNYTVTKVKKRMEQVDASIARYLAALDRADREEGDIAEAKANRLKEKITALRSQMQFLKGMERQVENAFDQQVSLTDPDARSMATSEALLMELHNGGARALAELRAAGQIGGFGAGINELGMIPRFLDLIDVDFFLVALPYTLLDQQVLDSEFPRCAEKGIGFVIGAVFASGILATGAVQGARYAYSPATVGMLRRWRASRRCAGATVCRSRRRRCNSRWAIPWSPR